MTVTGHPVQTSLPTGNAPAAVPALRLEQLEMLCSLAHAGTLTFVVNATVLCAVMWPVVPHERLGGWYGLVLLLGIARLALATTFRRLPRTNRNVRGWFAAVMAISLAAGCLWGGGGVLLVPGDSFLRQLFMAVLLAGMVAGAVPFLSVIQESYLFYAIPAIVPLMLRLLWQGDGLRRPIGAMLGLFLGMMIFASRRYFVMVNETLRLRFENEQLQQNLNDAKLHAEISAEELRYEMADRRKAQAALWQSEARFQRLIDQAADAFFLVDSEGRICEVNQQACDSMGFTYEELVASSAHDLYEQLDLGEIERSWHQVEAGQALTIELLSRRRDGSAFPVEARVSLFKTSGERFVLVLARDISERKKVERLKHEFISTVSHELRTPLTCIHASLAVLRGEQLEPLPKASKEMVEIAYKNGEQLIRLINDLLDVQKIESEMMEFRFEAVAVQPLVEEALATNGIIAEREGVRLEIVAEDSGAEVWVDRGRLMQVVGNLLSNAIKFSRVGETVGLAVMRVGGVVRVEVRDHGLGVPEDFRDKIFQKFTQADGSNMRQKGGTGLGLSICLMILERLKGRIGFESEVGRGSTFWFELPEYRG